MLNRNPMDDIQNTSSTNSKYAGVHLYLLERNFHLNFSQCGLFQLLSFDFNVRASNLWYAFLLCRLLPSQSYFVVFLL